MREPIPLGYLDGSLNKNDLAAPHTRSKMQGKTHAMVLASEEI